MTNAEEEVIYPAVDTSGSINEPPGSNTLPVEEGYVEPVPAITTMEPQEAEIGGADFKLVIGGDNIHGSTVIIFAGHDEPTTDNGDGTISTGVKPSLWTEPVVVPVKVRNGGVESEEMAFTFTAPAGTRHAEHVELDEDDDEKLPHHKRKRR
jgi:hypothetical protein